VIEGAQHGWRTPQIGQFWRFPPYYPDVVAPLITLGRGSPTGIACYRHVQFPARYRGGFFALDWTFGKVHFVGLQRKGASYAATAEVFLESVGDNGFAPTGCVVDPHTGDLFVSIGGRGTRGAVYRISYRGGQREMSQADAARFALPSRSLEWQPSRRQELLTAAIEGKPWQRLAFLQELRRHRSQFQDRELEPIVLACADADDANLRRAAAMLFSTLEPASRSEMREMACSPRAQAVLLLADAELEPVDRFHAAVGLLEDKNVPDEVLLAALRVMQLALGDVTARSASGTVWEGYTARQPMPTSLSASAWRALFPTGRAQVDRELSRLLAMLEDNAPSTLERVAAQLTPDSGPEDDFHYLAVLARLRGERSHPVTERTAHALLAIDEKLTARQATRDRHWPLRMAELHTELARKDPALNQKLLKAPSFGRPDHVVLTYAPGFDRSQAARVLVRRSESDAEFPWTPAHVELLGELPGDEVTPLARLLWSQPALRDALLPLLARAPEKADRSRFVAALSSPRLATIRMALDALEKLQAPDDGTASLALIRCLRSLPDGKEEKQLKDRLASALRQIAQADHGTDAARWSEWFSASYPNLASQLHGTDGVDVAGWSRRLQAIDWTRGDAGRGQVVYQKTGCASCHSGGQALGPDLRGVTGRFSREDLFTAIVQPSRDVSPRYQTTLIATVDGKVYQGSIIYEATDSVILQTGPTATLRIAGNQIASKRSTPVSLMPAGLLDQATDQDIADLLAYLRTLRGP
jgi:putative heme-binding domain-containing protein